MTEYAKRVAILWQSQDSVPYAIKAFDSLYASVGHNTGNIAFYYAVRSHIDGDIVVFPWHVPIDQIKAAADIIVIPCANQLGAHTDLGNMATRLTDMGLPIVAIGLGAQAAHYNVDIKLTDGTVRWAQIIEKSAISSKPNIATRGSYTYGQLEKLGITSMVSSGCPSLLINPAGDLGRRIHQNWMSTDVPKCIAVAGGHQSQVMTREIEHQLIALMMDPGGAGQYVVQSMAEMIKISRGIFDDIPPETMGQLRAHTVPHYSFEEFKSWCRSYARSYFDVPAWMDSLRNYDLTVGPRYHGVALALQAERMGLTITIDSRTRELCENTGVPFIPADQCKFQLTRANLKKFLKFDPDQYDRMRLARARDYVEFLENNSLKPSKYLYAMSDAAA